MNILILGATSDMAKALVNLPTKENHHFYLAARNVYRLIPFANDLKIRRNITSELLQFDVQKFDQHEVFYHDLDPKPDWVITFIGYLGEQAKAQINWDDSKNIMEINYTGIVSILNIVANDMELRGSGTIVGVSSVAGDRGRKSNYLYGSAKAGLTTYLSGMRNRLSNKGVHVMTVKPGFVDTQMTQDLHLPKAITASPEQIAKGIIKGIKNNKNTIYLLPVWRYIMLIIKNIPEFLFKKLKL
jgi:decaprenylphospho-beta-D-erythro-pentofuranosid-2-ulose 2-reductase